MLARDSRLALFNSSKYYFMNTLNVNLPSWYAKPSHDDMSNGHRTWFYRGGSSGGGETYRPKYVVKTIERSEVVPERSIFRPQPDLDQVVYTPSTMVVLVFLGRERGDACWCMPDRKIERSERKATAVDVKCLITFPGSFCVLYTVQCMALRCSRRIFFFHDRIQCPAAGMSAVVRSSRET